MAQSIGLQAQDSSHVPARSYPKLWKLRLATGWAILFAAVVGLFALSWDIQWHNAVGRDRTLTAPHLFILGSIAVMGITTLIAVLVETVWARRRVAVAISGMSTTFAGIFSSSRGSYLVGYGALASAIAFPIDQYWHTLYGIDVSIWAPFHIMVLAGLCGCCLGVADLLASGATLAAHNDAKGAARAGYIGVIIAFATLMGMFTLLLAPSTRDTGYISLGSLTFTIYPLMFGALGTFVLIAALRALPWRMMATSVTLVYLLSGLLNFLLIPPLMTLLLGIEQQNLRPGAPDTSQVAMAWQYSLIIAAVLLDVAVRVVRRRAWSPRKIRRVMIIATLVSISLAALCNPAFLDTAQGYGISSPHVIKQRIDPGTSPYPQAPGNLPQPQVGSVILIIAASLLPGLGGICIGNWLGASFGTSMRRQKESEIRPVNEGRSPNGGTQ